MKKKKKNNRKKLMTIKDDVRKELRNGRASSA